MKVEEEDDNLHFISLLFHALVLQRNKTELRVTSRNKRESRVTTRNKSIESNRLVLSLGSKVNAVALTIETFHLFVPLKQHLGGKHFADDGDLRQQPEEFYAAEIGALMKRWDKCINIGEDYVSK
ncbi:hypothetical protein AVEN_218024-1 [Araneus ventricosus]|uniref:Uncharacterized protein n=1 Tax=Araneus ventricosus TaxID=182803 RepID=A0A4Y2TJF7_ARAVE|nr:hypothetical protein AVEN_218024-1 [Araneus ventricosus]